MVDIIAWPYVISGLIEILGPLILAYYLIKRLGTSWKTWFIGAAMFLVSQIRIPLNNYLTMSTFSGEVSYSSYLIVYAIHGITAGLFEESARYIGFRYLIKDNRYSQGLTYGAGHGGIESILIVGVNVLTLGVILLTNPGSIPQDQLFSIYTSQWYLPFIGLYERAAAMILQIGLSVMVLESLRTKQIKYYLYAVLIHASIDYFAVLAISYSIFYSELVITAFTVSLAQWAYFKIKAQLKA